jgi:hypothetical protein
MQRKQNPKPLSENQSRLNSKEAQVKYGGIYSNGKSNTNGKNKAPKRRVNSKQKASQSMTQMMEKIAFDQNTSFGEAGLHFLETLVNPFGSGMKGPKHIAAPIPDGAADRFSACITTVGSFSGSTALEGFMEVIPCCRGVEMSAVTSHARVFYGGNPMDPSSSPTTIASLGFSLEDAMTQSMLAISDAKIRIKSIALRIKATSSALNTSGYLRAGLTHGNALATLVPAFNTYSRLNNSMVEESHQLMGEAEGITVRIPFSPENYIPQLAPTATTNDMQEYGYHPVVYFNISSTTTLYVETVVHFDLHVTATHIPFSLPLMPHEHQLSMIVDYANDHELVVGGDSFKSFYSKLRKTATGMYTFYNNNKNWIHPALATIF